MLKALKGLAAELKVTIHAGSLAIKNGDKVANRAFVWRTAAGVLIAAVVYGVLVAPVGRAHLQASAIVGERSADEAKLNSATPANYLAAAPSNWLYGRWGDVVGSAERRLFPGLVTVLLALLGLARPWTPPKVAYAVGLLLAIDLSLGFNGLTYHFLWNVALPFRGLRVPARMGLFTGFSLAVLAGYGVARLHALLSPPMARRGATIALAALIVIESSSWPFNLTLMATSPPAVYADMMAARGNRPRVAMVEFPLGQDPRYMYYSTFHWQDLLNGYSGFFPPSYQKLQEQTKSFPDDASLDYLRMRNVKFITVHGELLPPEEYRRILAAATGLRGLQLISQQRWMHSEITLYRLLSADGCESCDDSVSSISGAVATVSVQASETAVRRGHPVDITYTFTPTAAMAAIKGSYWVMAHFVDAEGQVRWLDDHQPPTATPQWRAGEPVRYTRTVFAPEMLPLGTVRLEIGLYSPDSQARLPLGAREIRGRAYEAASFRIEAAPPYAYPSGWFDHEGAPQDPVRWRWTRKEAVFSFPNPKADAQLYIDADAFARRPEPAHATVFLRGQVVAAFDVAPGVRTVQRIPLATAQLGGDDTCDAVIAVDRTYSPAELSNGATNDPRQLGIRVFNVAVRARP